MAIKAKKAGVQIVYTEQGVSAIVHAQKRAGKSLRAIAAEYGSPVNHADIERILQGKFPHDPGKRHALGLTPICEHCGQKVRRVRAVPGWVRRGAEFLASRKNLDHKGHEVSQRVYSRKGRPV